MKKVLIIRLGAIGDVIHSTIIADTIKLAYPNCEIHFLTTDYISGLLESHRSISKIFCFDNSKKNDIFYLTKLGLKLRKEKYTKVFALTSSSRVLYLSLLVNPFCIVSRSKNSTGIEGFYQTALKLDKNMSKPQELKININQISLENILQYTSSPYFVFCPCGANDNERQGRIWCSDYWIELGNFLANEYNTKIFICGAKSEILSHEKYSAIKNVEILTGKLSLAESAALFSKAMFVISGDSGPLHIASATGRKTIGIMGSTDPKSNGAYGKNGFNVIPRTECKFCGMKKCKMIKNGETYTPCISSIKPQDVIDIIEKNIEIKFS